MQTPLPLTRDVVLIGGGHTHALVLRRWGMSPLPGARLTLIDPDATAAYSGMLPGHIAGHYPRADLQIDLVRLARHAGARLIPGRACGIDLGRRTVNVPGRPGIAFDLLSIDIGITSRMPALPGFAEHAVPAKPLAEFAARWEEFVATSPTRRVTVIGAGVAGVEIALAAAHRLGQGDGPAATVTLLEASDTPLGLIGSGARRRLLRHLDRLNVRLLTAARAARITAEAVHLDDGREVPGDFTIGAAGAQPQGWLGDTGLALHAGFVSVGADLRSLSDPAVFAVGDCAHLSHAPRPKAGVYAVREAPILFDNLRALLTDTPLRRYHPQKDYLKLVSTGDKHAVADRFGLPLDGAWLWRWKDRIDRTFMAQFQDLPAMPAPKPPAAVAVGVAEELASGKPLCGGCGAKMGGAGLSRILSALPPPRRADTLSGPGDDAAMLVHGDETQVITTDHLRAFTEDPWLLAKITAIHAMGDIWAMGAKPQAALAQVILPRMSETLQHRTLSEIMDAAAETVRAAGADLVGGHTSIGAELTLGFTVTGLGREIVTLRGARPGDALILTKPLGTGTILAAEMARAAPGAVVAACLQSMQHPQGTASAILAPKASAMTDVTGFGLAGHLLAMLDAAGCGARIDLAAVALLPGAEALSAAGHASTIAPANRAAAAARMTFTESARAALLFDPQTAGGLLAAVRADAVATVLDRLGDAGEAAALIGEITEGAPHLSVE